MGLKRVDIPDSIVFVLVWFSGGGGCGGDGVGRASSDLILCMDLN